MPLALLAELKRRRVFRALVGYGIAAFAVLQIIEPVMHGLQWPDAVLSYAVVALAAGFPIVVTLAWIFDVTDGGLARTPSKPLGAGLVLLLIGIGMLAAAPGLLYYFVVRSGGGAAEKAGAVRGPSIAVLPLVNLSSDREQDYFADGLAEQLLNLLANVQGLHVAGRSSSFFFKGKSEDLRTIGQKLNVGTVLEGSVRRAGDRIRITAQLTDTVDGYQRWSETYDRKLTDVFSVQDEIARAVVAALKFKLLPEEAPTTREQRTDNQEAYRQYLLGRHFFNRGNPEGIRLAAKAFENALALDPGYAPAWAGLAHAEFYMAGWVGGSAAAVTDAAGRALTAAERAVALAPALSDGYSARGKMRGIFKWDWEGGRADMERALALNPSDVIALRAMANDVLLPVGRLREAVAAARKATELDPLDTNAWVTFGLTLCYAGETDSARSALGHALEVGPDNDWAAYNLGFVDLADGRPASALPRFAVLRTEWMRLTGVALSQRDLGHAAESKAALDALLTSHADDSGYQVAQVYARRDEHDRAFQWLDRAYSIHDTGLRYLKQDPVLKGLRGDPRFGVLLRKMNLPAD